MITRIEADSEKCAFCGRTASDAITLITGPDCVSICNICVSRASEMLAEIASENKEGGSSDWAMAVWCLAPKNCLQSRVSM